MIYGIDFDGTIVEENFPQIGKPIQPTIDFIREVQASAENQWILITMREEKYLEEALAWLKEHRLYPDAVNDNLPERVAKWGNNPRKIYADVYIDDHNSGGLCLPEIRMGDMKQQIKQMLNLFFNRKESTKWSDKELAALKKVAARPEAQRELNAIAGLYQSDYPYKRSAIITLLNNWTTEVDRAATRPNFHNNKTGRYYANGKHIGSKPEHFDRSDEF